MAKKRPESQPPETEKQAPKPKKPKRAPSGFPWHPVWRSMISLCVVMHLLAVFVAPWDLATVDALPPGYIPTRDNLGRTQPPAPELFQKPAITRTLREFFNPYLNLLYLNHGYEFFAPDPAGTHVIDYRVKKADGSEITGRFPDTKEQWPRLLYHRHMMLAEQTQLIGPESGKQYASHLATIHGGQTTLDLKFHTLLSPAAVAAETPLTDPSTYKFVGTAIGVPRPKPVVESLPSQSNESPISIPGAGQ